MAAFTTNKRQLQEQNIKHALPKPTELRLSHNGQFIIFTLSSDTEGCIRELLASAMNNLSQAATCEIIQLTRIYNASWSFLHSLGFMKHGVARDRGSPVMRLHIYFSSLFFIYLFIW